MFLKQQMDGFTNLRREMVLLWGIFDVNKEFFSEFLISIKDKIESYGEENVSNRDETGLFWKFPFEESGFTCKKRNKKE